MSCPHCKLSIDSDADHRMCVFELLKTGTIQSVSEWERLCRPKPKRKIIRARVLKEPSNSQGTPEQAP